VIPISYDGLGSRPIGPVGFADPRGATKGGGADPREASEGGGADLLMRSMESTDCAGLDFRLRGNDNFLRIHQ